MSHRWTVFNALWERCSRPKCGESRLVDPDRRDGQPYDAECKGAER